MYKFKLDKQNCLALQMIAQQQMARESEIGVHHYGCYDCESECGTCGGSCRGDCETALFSEKEQLSICSVGCAQSCFQECGGDCTGSCSQDCSGSCSKTCTQTKKESDCCGGDCCGSDSGCC